MRKLSRGPKGTLSKNFFLKVNIKRTFIQNIKGRQQINENNKLDLNTKKYNMTWNTSNMAKKSCVVIMEKKEKKDQICAKQVPYVMTNQHDFECKTM